MLRTIASRLLGCCLLALVIVATIVILVPLAALTQHRHA